MCASGMARRLGFTRRPRDTRVAAAGIRCPIPAPLHAARPIRAGQLAVFPGIRAACDRRWKRWATRPSCSAPRSSIRIRSSRAASRSTSEAEALEARGEEEIRRIGPEPARRRPRDLVIQRENEASSLALQSRRSAGDSRRTPPSCRAVSSLALMFLVSGLGRSAPTPGTAAYASSFAGRNHGALLPAS